jgi:endonuclease-3
MMDGLKQKAEQISKILAEFYPDWHTELKFGSTIELLVAAVLAAQCTDKKVNEVTDKLFRKYKTASDYADAEIKVLENEIKSTGFYRAKAKTLKSLCQEIVKRFKGKVPEEFGNMLKLPGVGRKTANMVLSNTINRPGITVDRHVIRLSGMIGLSRSSDPGDIERDLMKLLPESEWNGFSGRLILHGRYLCRAKKPECERCPVISYCDFARIIHEQCE